MQKYSFYAQKLEASSTFLDRLRRSGLATVTLVSDLAAPGGKGSELRYMRVANDIAARIKSGELEPGTRLLSEPDLAAYYEVAYHTIRGAMRVLRERGLIETIHGRGTFVCDPLPPDQES